MANPTSASILSGESLARVRVSVVVPTYERIEPLRQLLGSLAEQRLESGSFEVVLSDDGSGPDVLAAARELAPRFQRLVFVRGPNAGPGVARNRGTAHAAGATLAFIDSDCLAPPSWLEALTRAIELGAAIAHGPVMSAVPAVEPFIHSFQVQDVPLLSANFAVARQPFELVGGFRSEISRIAEDHDLVERLRAAGHAPVFVPDAAVNHPPRLKRVSMALLPDERASSVYRQLATFYRSFPARQRDRAAANLRLLAKAAAKLAILVAPLALLPPPGWLLGPAVFATVSLRKWYRANQLLRRGGANFRVPMIEAAKYAAFMPLQDTVALAHRARFGLLSLRSR